MYLAIDLGTTMIKCALYGEDGRMGDSLSFPCSLSHPSPGCALQDPAAWYEDVCDDISRLTASKPDICGISVSSQGLSFVPVDAEFHPLAPAVSWLDSRAEEEMAALLEKLPQSEWILRTGRRLTPCSTLPKLMQMCREQPEIFEKAAYFLLPMDYLNARFTGSVVLDPSMAAGTMLYDITVGAWDTELCGLAGIEPAQLGAVRPCGSLVGTVNRQTAARTGLMEGTPIFCGGQDQKVAAYAVGIGEGMVSLSLGTAGALEMPVGSILPDTALSICPYVTPGSLVAEGCINTAGAAIQWVKDSWFPDLDYDAMNRLAEASPVGSGGLRFHPHLAKPGTPHLHLDCDGELLGITLATTRGDLIRALYEGLAYEVRLNLEAAAQLGCRAGSLVVFGGGSKSRALCRILADVTGLPVLALKNGEMGLGGAAKLCALGLGGDAQAFGQHLKGECQQYTPEEERKTQYARLYKAYCTEGA